MVVVVVVVPVVVVVVVVVLEAVVVEVGEDLEMLQRSEREEFLDVLPASSSLVSVFLLPSV